MRAPDFWQRKGVLSTLLWPLGYLLGQLTMARARRQPRWRAPVPVICIGNVTAGGAGKTPTALAIMALLRQRGVAGHFLTRGYKGRLAGPVQVDLTQHTHRDVGDEPLLLAQAAPTWVAKDRLAGAKAAIAAGAQVLVMDDGLQNPALHKDCSFIVIDGGYGLGNRRLLPAGPLRETLASAKARADAALIIGADTTGIRTHLSPLPVFDARLVPDITAESLAGKRVVAAAGIGRPEKFFDTLRDLGATLVEALPFPDHHVFSPDDIALICELAAARDAMPVTTEKDYWRLSENDRALLTPVPVCLSWGDVASVASLLDQIMSERLTS